MYLAQGSSGTQVADLNRLLTGNNNSYFSNDTYNAVVQLQNQYASEVLAPAGLVYATGQPTLNFSGQSVMQTYAVTVY